MRQFKRFIYIGGDMGILICGLNGVGKSTIGKKLAERLSYRFIDNENLYFPKDDKSYMFSNK